MAVPSSSPRAQSTLYRYMTRSHDYLHQLLSRVLATMEVNARDGVRALWAELDEGLLAHLEAKERFVIPVLADVDADEARTLLCEHVLLRERLVQVGIAVEHGCLRYDGARELAELFARHAGREQNLLHRWVG